MPDFSHRRGVAALACALAAAAGGCSLADVTTEPGEDVLVVEGVLRTDAALQAVLLHHTLNGRFVGGEPGATISVRAQNGEVFPFQELQGPDKSGCATVDPRYAVTDSLDFRGTCYITEPGRRWVQPGGVYDLEVRTADGRVVRGRTLVPQDFSVPVLATSNRFGEYPVCTLAPNTPLPLVWRRSPTAWAYVAQVRIVGLGDALQDKGIERAPDPLELRGLAVSSEDTTIVFPAEFGVFERFQYDQDVLLAIQDGLPSGSYAEVVIAAADRNWVNGVRGGTFNPSGQVRISSVVGDGVGVFGSLVLKSARIDVRPDVFPARCGPGLGPADPETGTRG